MLRRVGYEIQGVEDGDLGCAGGDALRDKYDEPSHESAGARSSPSLQLFQRIGRSIDKAQRRHRPLAFVVGVFKKFSDDRAGQLAALVAYYSFFSIFPLLLVLVTVLGYVFGNDASVQHDLAGSALSHIPVVGDGLATGALHGHGAGLMIGLLGALWAGLGATTAAQNAMNAVWDVPVNERPNFIHTRLRALLALAVLGAGLFGTTVLSAIGSLLSGFAVVTQIAVGLGNVALNILVIGLAFAVLTDKKLSRRQILPGATLAGVLYYGLQTLGTRLVARRIDAASDVYGTFASVIGLLTYFYLLAQVTLWAVELNVVLDRRLFPRSLFGGDPTDADRRARQRYIDEVARDKSAR